MSSKQDAREGGAGVEPSVTDTSVSSRETSPPPIFNIQSTSYNVTVQSDAATSAPSTLTGPKTPNICFGLTHQAGLRILATIDASFALLALAIGVIKFVMNEMTENTNGEEEITYFKFLIFEMVLAGLHVIASGILYYGATSSKKTVCWASYTFGGFVLFTVVIFTGLYFYKLKNMLKVGLFLTSIILCVLYRVYEGFVLYFFVSEVPPPVKVTDLFASNSSHIKSNVDQGQNGTGDLEGKGDLEAQDGGIGNVKMSTG